MLPATLMDALEETLRQTKDILQQFLSCLQNEKDVLERNDLSSLESVTTQKQVMTSTLHSISTQCHNILQSTNLNFSDKGMNTLFAQLPYEKRESLMQLWREIKSMLMLSDQYNTRNGIVINMLKMHNDALLKIMTRQVAPVDYSDLNKKSKASISTRAHKA